MCIPIEHASDVWVVATPSGNSQQSVTLGGTAAGDTITLNFNGQTRMPSPATLRTVTFKTALQALSTLGAGTCLVSGNAGGPYTVEFQGALAKTDVPLLSAAGIGLNEQQTIAVTGGGPGTSWFCRWGSVQPQSWITTQVLRRCRRLGRHELGWKWERLGDGRRSVWVGARIRRKSCTDGSERLFPFLLRHLR